MGEEVRMSEYGNGDDEDEDRISEWEIGLPDADDLTQLSQALISPELASAFRISIEPYRTVLEVNRASQNTLASLRANFSLSQDFSSSNNLKSFAENRDPILVEQEDGDRSNSRKTRKIDSTEEADSALRADNSGDDPSARTLKRPRLVWTPQLHKRFVDVVAHLGINKAVPKTIMQLMNVEGLTRENVASHLQKYRLYLKRMHGLSNEGPSSSDHLFASTPVPQSLQENGVNHGSRHMPVPIQMPYGAPAMIPMPIYGMPHGHMGMQIANPAMNGSGYHGFESSPYMLQQRDWSGARYGMSYQQQPTAPNDK